AGRTHFPFFSRNPWKTFLLGMTSFSFLPIYVCGGLAIAGTLVSVALTVAALVLFVRASSSAGLVALAPAGLFLWSTMMAAVAALGTYVIRIYKDVRGRPAYVVESTVGITAQAERVQS